MSKPSFFMVNNYYSDFLTEFYATHSELAHADYETIHDAISRQRFGVSDAYSTILGQLGHRATEVISGDLKLQGAWALEHGSPPYRHTPVKRALGRIPYVRRFTGAERWLESLLIEQIHAEKPDVVYFYDLRRATPRLIAAIRRHVSLIVGQIASPLPEDEYVRQFDLILTSFPHFVDRIRKLGPASEYFRLAFDPRVLDAVAPSGVGCKVAFVGGIANVHAAGTATLEQLARAVDVDFWGYGVDNLGPDSPLRTRFHGQAWGLKMYEILADASIVVNRHSAASEGYANNMRLYEATGVGAFLLTDEKQNLGELFEVGSEVETYRDADELIDKTRYFLEHEDERMRIAKAGQARTLKDHTYLQRMEELETIIARYV